MSKPRATFRLVKGAPITIILAMLKLGGQAGVEELCDLTTYTDKTVVRALQVLLDAGLVKRVDYHKGYVLTQHGLQIPLVLSGRDTSEIFSEVPEKIISPVVNDLSIGFNSLDSPDSTTNNSREISPKSAERLAALQKAGIGGKVRDELVGDDYLTPGYIAGHDAMRCEEGFGTGMLVTRLRAHAILPARFLKTPCPECGLRGKHADHCRRKYYESVNK